jgi:hypothetical protein
MVHASSSHAALQEEVARLKTLTPKSLEDALAEKTRETGLLQQSLQANRRVFIIVSVVTFFLGIAVGYAFFHRSQKKQEEEK